MDNISVSGILYIGDVSNTIQSSTDLIDWEHIDFPVTLNNVGNSNVKFINSMSFDTFDKYFIINSSTGNLIIDSSGSTQNITVSGYAGLFQNGNSVSGGQSDVTIQNFSLSCSGLYTSPNSGWLCQQYYANSASGNKIINCNSDGNIGDYGGGILGSNCANGSGILNINNCYSLGSIGQHGGGIVGSQAGNNENSDPSLGCFINTCYSIGTIGQYAGGIAGYQTGYNDGNCQIENCYSAGSIDSYGGGITGGNTATSSGIVNINNCYSLGLNNLSNINAGGITGNSTAVGTNISNCYTTGSRIMGSNSSGIISNCNTDSGSWNIGNTNGILYASGWITTNSNGPYLLEYFNNTSPYINNSATVAAGNTVSLPLTGYNYPFFVLLDNANASGIFIDSNGSLTTNSSLSAQTLNLQILNGAYLSNGAYYPYTISNFTLTVYIPPDISNDTVFNGLLTYDSVNNIYNLNANYTAHSVLYIYLPKGSTFNGNNYTITLNKDNTDDLFQIQELNVSPVNQNTIIVNLGVIGNTEIVSNSQNILISDCNFNINNNSVIGNHSSHIQLYNNIYTGFTSLIANNCKYIVVISCILNSKLLYQSKIGAITGIKCKNIHILKSTINTQLFNKWNSGIIGYKNKNIYIFDTKVDVTIYTYNCASFLCSNCQNATLIKCIVNIHSNFKYYKYYIPKCYNIYLQKIKLI